MGDGDAGEREAAIVDSTAAQAERQSLPELDATGSGPTTLSMSLLALQRAAGNRAVARLVAQGGSTHARHGAGPALRRALIQRQERQEIQGPRAELEVDAQYKVNPADTDPALLDKLRKTDKVAVSFYEAYETGTVNDTEFKVAGEDFARTYGTLGLGAGKLMDGKAIAVKFRDDVQQALTSIHQALYALAYNDASAAGSGGRPSPPEIGTIAIFAHGMPKSLGLDPVGETGSRWFSASQIQGFADAIRPLVSSDIRVLLFACSTGRGDDETDKMPAPDAVGGGKGSFADQLAKALGGGATVFAHNKAGHAESNVLASVFKATTPGGGREEMFNVLYPRSFVDSEVERVKRDKANLLGGASDDKVTAKLRETMWSHFLDAVASDFKRWDYSERDKKRHFHVGGYGGVGAAMFMEPEKTAELLQGDFRTSWLTDERLGKLFGTAAATQQVSRAVTTDARRLLRSPQRDPSDQVGIYMDDDDWARAAWSLGQLPDEDIRTRIKAMSTRERKYVISGARHSEPKPWVDTIVTAMMEIDQRSAIVGSLHWARWKHEWARAANWFHALSLEDGPHVAKDLGYGPDELAQVMGSSPYLKQMFPHVEPGHFEMKWPTLRGGAQASPEEQASLRALVTARNAVPIRTELAAKVAYAGKSDAGYKYAAAGKGTVPATTERLTRLALAEFYSGEGGVSAVVTYDKTLSFGPGFADVLAAQWMRDWFNHDAAAQRAFEAVGMTVSPAGTGWIVVDDSDPPNVIEGEQARQFIRNNQHLLTVFANLAEAPEHITESTDAQVRGIHRKLNEIPADLRGEMEKWPDDGVVSSALHAMWWLPAGGPSGSPSRYRGTNGDPYAVARAFAIGLATTNGANLWPAPTRESSAVVIGATGITAGVVTHYFDAFGRGGGNKGVLRRAVEASATSITKSVNDAMADRALDDHVLLVAVGTSGSPPALDQPVPLLDLGRFRAAKPQTPTGPTAGAIGATTSPPAAVARAVASGAIGNRETARRLARQEAATISAPSGNGAAPATKKALKVVVVGSPGKAEVDAKHPFQFANAAKAVGGTSADTVWLVEQTGYDLGHVPRDGVTDLAGSAEVRWITPEKPLSKRLAEFDDGSIATMKVYSHGLVGLVALRHGWDDNADYGLSTSEARQLSAKPFADSATIEFDSCNAGTGGDDSITQTVADATRVPVTGYTGRTSYHEFNDPTVKDPKVEPSEIRARGHTDWREIGSRYVFGEDPVQKTSTPRSLDFDTTFDIRDALDSRLIVLPQSGSVSVHLEASGEVGQGAQLTVKLRSRGVLYDSDVKDAAVLINSGAVDLKWDGLDPGKYYLRLSHATEKHVRGSMSVRLTWSGSAARLQRSASGEAKDHLARWESGTEGLDHMLPDRLLAGSGRILARLAKYPPGKEPTSGWWGKTGSGIAAELLGQRVAADLLSDTQYQGAAPEVLNGYWIVDIVHAVEVIREQGKLGELSAVSGSWTRIKLAIDLISDPAGFDPAPALATLSDQEYADLTGTHRDGTPATDPSGAPMRSQIDELKGMRLETAMTEFAADRKPLVAAVNAAADDKARQDKLKALGAFDEKRLPVLESLSAGRKPSRWAHKDPDVQKAVLAAIELRIVSSAVGDMSKPTEDVAKRARQGHQPDENWCGFFAADHYTTENFGKRLKAGFSSTLKVLAFFEYHYDWVPGAVPKYIKADDGSWQELHDYHKARGSERHWYRTAELADWRNLDIQPGDIVTISVPTAASKPIEERHKEKPEGDHIVMAYSYDKDTGHLFTIGGNDGGYIIRNGDPPAKETDAQKADRERREAATGLSLQTPTSTTPSGHVGIGYQDLSDQKVGKAGTPVEHVHVAGVGRPSIVDFEDHDYTDKPK